MVYLSVAIASCLIGQSSVVPPLPDGERNAGMPTPGAHMARARVIDEYVLDGFIISVHRVEHYFGRLPGDWPREFEYRHPQRPLHYSSRLTYLERPPKVGDVGMWILKRRNQTMLPLLTPAWGVRFPVWKDADSNYADVERMAVVIEQFGEVAEDERLSILNQHAMSKHPLVGHWAVTAMAVDKPESYRMALDHLIVNRNLTVGAQLALDIALSDVQGNFWEQSELRVAMFREWLSRDKSDYEDRMVKERFIQVGMDSKHIGFGVEQRDLLLEELKRSRSGGPPQRP